MNFDNPVYRKTTEDQFSLEKNQYQPARSYPSVSFYSVVFVLICFVIWKVVNSKNDINKSYVSWSTIYVSLIEPFISEKSYNKIIFFKVQFIYKVLLHSVLTLEYYNVFLSFYELQFVKVLNFLLIFEKKKV